MSSLKQNNSNQGHVCTSLSAVVRTECDCVYCSLRFVSDWVYSGVFRDVYGEFMIQVNEEYLGCRGEPPRIPSPVLKMKKPSVPDRLSSRKK